MSIINEKFNKARARFEAERRAEDGFEVMNKITVLINELGSNFNGLNGGELAEMQVKLAGYKFYLVDYIASLNQISEALKLQAKEMKAVRWDEVTADIKAVEGRVKNKEQIENVITIEAMPTMHEQILYENMFYKYRLKLDAINDISTALVQKIAERKREMEQTKIYN